MLYRHRIDTTNTPDTYFERKGAFEDYRILGFFVIYYRKSFPEMASPYADALPDFAGPGRRVLRQGARQKCAGFSEMRVLPENNVFSRRF